MIYNIIMFSKNNFKEPLNIYDYYANNYNPLYLALIAKKFQDLKFNTLIARYNQKCHSIYTTLTEKEINTIRKTSFFLVVILQFFLKY